MSAELIHGDARHVSDVLEPNSVSLIVTSPPYFALRSYQDGGEHYDGQIGSEPTPTEFVDALIACTADWVKVMRPDGSIWVNLGDKYAGSGGGNQSGLNGTASQKATALAMDHMAAFNAPRRYNQASDGIAAKSLMGLPWRYALRCIDELGLILRAEVIWCLSGGAKVYAEINGKPRPVMIRDLVRSYRPETVRLWNGEKWTQVLGWNKSNDTDGAIEIELRSGERIGCTPNHQWPTSRGLLKAHELVVGDVIDTCRLPDAKKHHAGLDDHLTGWLVGMYIAEGSRSETVIQIAGHANEHARQLRTIADMFDGSLRVHQTDENAATANLTGSVLLGIIDRYVSPGTAKTKRLTQHAWARSDGFLRGVIAGYLDGDGHHDEANNRWRLGFCANDEWATDLRTLAARLGASLTLTRTIHDGSYGSFPGWRGEWRDTPSTHHNAKERSEIITIRASRARHFYDIGVEDEPHLFALASGVLTHNSKPNGLPESVTDRVRRSHEQWFHFTLNPRYFAAVDEIREAQDRTSGGSLPHVEARRSRVEHRSLPNNPDQYNPLGKLPGSVWTVPTEPLRVPADLGVDHFAAFPSEWPRRIILGWSPPGICTACGQGRRPIVEKEAHGAPRGINPGDKFQRSRMPGAGGPPSATDVTATIVGYACDCPDTSAPTTPAVVLDPFGGTGTVAVTAHHLGRHGVHFDLSRDYLRLAQWRLDHDTALRDKVLNRSGIARPADPAIDGQMDLFGGAA